MVQHGATWCNMVQQLRKADVEVQKDLAAFVDGASSKPAPQPPQTPRSASIHLTHSDQHGAISKCDQHRDQSSIWETVLHCRPWVVTIHHVQIQKKTVARLISPCQRTSTVSATALSRP